MKSYILWRKMARIVMQLSDRLAVSPEQALSMFYQTKVCDMLHDDKYGLHLMSDTYIVNDIVHELQDKQE